MIPTKKEFMQVWTIFMTAKHKSHNKINSFKARHLFMATIKYQCDTCKRNIELLENARGLNSFNSCVITDGCRGKLYKTSRNAYNLREAFAEADPAGYLDNFSPRKIFFKHNQGILSDRWVIRHNLNARPVVKVFIESEDGLEIAPLEADSFSVNYNSPDELQIVFNSPFIGQAHLISRSITEESVETIPALENMVPVSYNGTLSFAVISKYFDPLSLFPTAYTNGPIQIDIVLEEPNEEPIFCVETLTGLETGSSPWNDFRSILFRRRRNFNIKTKNIEDLRVIKDRYDSVSDIPQLTRLTIRAINFYPDGSNNFQEIKSKQLLMLLAREPYDKADKNLDRVIDLGEISQQTENMSFVFVDGVLYSDPGNVENVYPKIEKDDVVVPAPSPSPTPTVSLSSTPMPTPTPTPTPTASPSGGLQWVDITPDWIIGDGFSNNVQYDGECWVLAGTFGFGSDPIVYNSSIGPVYGLRFTLELTGGAGSANVSIDIQTNAGNNFEEVVVNNGQTILYELDENSGIFDQISSLEPATLMIGNPQSEYDFINMCSIEVLIPV